MHQPRQRADQVGAGAKPHRILARADFQVTAHAGCQVHDDVDTGVTNTLHHLPVQRSIAARLAGLRMAHMAMRHRRAGLGRFDRGGGDLRRRDRHIGILADGVASAGQCAGDDDVVVHAVGPVRIDGDWQRRSIVRPIRSDLPRQSAGLNCTVALRRNPDPTGDDYSLTGSDFVRPADLRSVSHAELLRWQRCRSWSCPPWRRTYVWPLPGLDPQSRPSACGA